MATWKHIILAGVLAACLSLLTGVQTKAALPMDDYSYKTEQESAPGKPKIVNEDSVIYLDGKDQICVEGENISSVSYSSDDATVAEIDNTGIITPVSIGKTKIHAAVTCQTNGEKTTETLSYDLQVFAKSTTYFRYDTGKYVGKSRIVGLTPKGKQLRDVYIPGWCDCQEVLEVHVDTFKNDTALQRVYVPDNLLYLDYIKRADDYWPGESFSGCTNLKELHLGKNLKGIGEGFASSLEEITVDEQNKIFQVQDHVLFAEKNRLVCYPGARKESFYQIPEGIETVERYAFIGAKNLKKVGFPKGIKEISYAFCYSGLTGVVIPESVKYYACSFAYCNSLKQVAIETGTQELVYSVFTGCENLKSIHVKHPIPGKILTGCKSVEEICLLPNAEDVIVKDGVLFSADGKKLLAYPAGKKTSYSLPAATEKIADYAFYEAGVSQIRCNQRLREIGSYAFQESKITTLVLPDSVQKLGTCAFENCRRLCSVKLSKNLKTIPNYAFRNCVSLTKLHIPAKVRTFGINNGCLKLTAFTVEKENPSLLAKEGVLYSKSGKILYAYPPGKKEKHYAIPSTVKKIWNHAFADQCYIQEITMENQVTHCASGAFSNAGRLEKVSLSKNLEVLGDHAFSNCRKLKSMTIPDHVQRLELGTFSNCTAIRHITLGKRVKFVDVWNFNGCINLQRLTCRSLFETWSFGNTGVSFDQAGSRNYEKLVVRFPECKDKNKRSRIKYILHQAGLNQKAKVIFGNNYTADRTKEATTGNIQIRFSKLSDSFAAGQIFAYILSAIRTSVFCRLFVSVLYILLGYFLLSNTSKIRVSCFSSKAEFNGSMTSNR